MNKTAKLVEKLKSLPLGHQLLNLAIGQMIPFVGTSDVEILEMTASTVKVRIKNRRKVRNHIGQVHAAAMILLAETATGLVVGMNVADSSMPLIKELKTKFVKRSKGEITATARLSSEQLHLFKLEKSETLVSVEVRDSLGEEPILVEALWAWTGKKKAQG